MVSIRPLISKSSNLYTNPLVTVPSVPNTIRYLRHLHVPWFLSSLARSRYLSLFALSFNFTLWSAGTANFTIRMVLFLLLTFTRSGPLAEIRWSVFITKSQSSLYVSFSWMDSGLSIYHLFVWSNLNFLHDSQEIIFLYYFCANLLHSLIMWLIVSSLSPHYYPWEFFTLVLADSLSLEPEWQQVSSSLQDSSQYSDRSQ